jgi:hypothetical protein
MTIWLRRGEGRQGGEGWRSSPEAAAVALNSGAMEVTEGEKVWREERRRTSERSGRRRARE